MIVPSICNFCTHYTNAMCIVYPGPNLAALNVATNETLDSILPKINNTFSALTGSGSPTAVPKYIGQLYYDTGNQSWWVGISTTTASWAQIGSPFYNSEL